MTMPDKGRGPSPEENSRSLIAQARPDQIRRLLNDIWNCKDDGFPQKQGTA